eukprot:scaffold1949_cov119-Cylindrotheca_fusiformis.AAC.12
MGRNERNKTSGFDEFVKLAGDMVGDGMNTSRNQGNKTSGLDELVKLAGDLVGDGMNMGSGGKNKTSSIDELVKLAGDMVGDGMNMIMGMDIRDDPSTLDSSDDEESRSSGGGRTLRRNRRIVARQKKALRRQRDAEEAEMIRRHKEIGEDREGQLRERLSKLDQLLAAKDKVEEKEETTTTAAKKPVTKVYGKVKKAPCPEEQTFQVVYEDEVSSLHKIIDPEDMLDDISWNEDDYTEQRVHEMLQLLHHCRKTKDEAQRLIGYKRSAIERNREVHPELEAQIARTVNHRKLEKSTRRFMNHMKNGEMPKTLETLEMEKELLENIKSMKLMAEESYQMTLLYQEYESLYSE